jgi:DNA-binding response OmpR family regulator
MPLRIAVGRLGGCLERPPHRDRGAVLSFPPFPLDVAEGRLWKDGRELRLRPKPFAILRHLTQHPRRRVTRSEIVEAQLPPHAAAVTQMGTTPANAVL